MSAFRASYSDWKLVRTRQVVQIVFEVPLADADKVYEVLGGMPNPSGEQWFGIAAIRSADRPRQIESKRTAGVKRDWADLPPQQQAGIRCEEQTFITFLRERDPDDWHESGEDAAECVRMICDVKSRAELSTNQKSRVIWHQLDEQYQAWKVLEQC